MTWLQIIGAFISLGIVAVSIYLMFKVPDWLTKSK